MTVTGPLMTDPRTPPARPGPQITVSRDQRRLHLHYGPIDLIIEADGSPRARAAARAAAIARFEGLLEELVSELALLRTPVQPDLVPQPVGPVAARMVAAVAPHRFTDQVTPMAAVAGAVADEIGAAMAQAAPLDRWSVNNGGDIAIGLSAGHHYRAGLVVDPRRGEICSAVTVEAGMGIGGLATSGRHGRSFSLGIADAVTVLAPSAAAADAAATLIANRVDLGEHAAIIRQQAQAIDPDSDLGRRPVTVSVGPLSDDEVSVALARGLARAEEMVAQALIAGAVLHLAGRVVSSASPLLTGQEIGR